MIIPASTSRYADRLDGLDVSWLTGLGCVLWFRGKTETDCPIIPAGVTATPEGTWTSDLTLSNGRTLKTFDGSTNYISLTDNNAWDIVDGNFTICGWFRCITPGIRRPIIGQYQDEYNIYRCVYDADNVLHFAAFSTGLGVVNAIYSCPFTPISATWYYLTIIRSGSACLMYINGISQTVTTTQAWRNTTALNGSLLIGKYVSAYHDGNYKDIMIFKGTALTEAQITQIYNTTKKYLVI